MYDINVNFLKERGLDNQAIASLDTGKKTSLKERLPMLIGGGVALGLIGLVGGAFLLLNSQKSNTKQQIANLDAEIQRLQGQSSQIQQIQKEIDEVNKEIGILISVFDQIKPWSAILDEIGSITPPNVQINSITESESQEKKKQLTIIGTADSYENVNDFLLSLKNSRFLDAEKTRIITSSWIENPAKVIIEKENFNQNPNKNPVVSLKGTEQSSQPTLLEVNLPEVVEFNVVTQINNEPSQDLINELNRRGAIGLVSRLNTLKRKGALEIEPIINQEEPKSTTEGES
jgi:type IV pilus assembly protein PilN